MTLTDWLLLAIAGVWLVLGLVVLYSSTTSARRRRLERLLRREADQSYSLCLKCGYVHPVQDGWIVEHQRTRKGTRLPEVCPGSFRSAS